MVAAKNLIKGDRVIWMIFLLLCAISLLEVYSAASTLVYKQGVWEPILRHASYLLGGVVCIIVVQNIPVNIFRSGTVFVYLSIIGLVVVSNMPKINGASRTIDLGLIQWQPSETAKGGMVILTALVLAYATRTKEGFTTNGFWLIVGHLIVLVGLIVTENFSTAGILYITIFLMMIIGKVNSKQLLWMFFTTIAGTLLFALAIFAVSPKTYDSINKSMPVMEKFTHRFDTWRNRFTNHGEEENMEEMDPFGNNAQRIHANIAIATSNVVGTGPGNSVERDYLSQAYSDFIYAIILEEMGWLGGTFVVALYVFLLIRASRIAQKCTDPFQSLMVIGLTLLMVLQALVNMSVAVGLIPVTGQPLPMISRGGNSILANCVYIGIILSVSRNMRKRQHLKDKKRLNSETEIESAKKTVTE